MAVAHHFAGHPTHADGIIAHVLIWMNGEVDFFDACNRIAATKTPGSQVVDTHFGLGEIDGLADIFAPWTKPRGDETRHIAAWINKIRKLKDADGRFYVKRTSTIVCISGGGP